MGLRRPAKLVEIAWAPSYYAGSDGNIYSWKTNSLKLLKPRVDSRGYLAVFLHSGTGERKDVRVHRLICAAFHGEAPSQDRYLIRHLDGDKTNSRPENLAWGTRAENYQDYVAHQQERQYREWAAGLEAAPF